MKKNIIKKLLAASIAALALFAFTGCPGSPENDTKSEPGVLETRFPTVIGKYKGKTYFPNDILEIFGDDTYKLTTELNGNEIGNITYVRQFYSDEFELAYCEFKLTPTIETCKDGAEYRYLWWAGESNPLELRLPPNYWLYDKFISK